MPVKTEFKGKAFMQIFRVFRFALTSVLVLSLLAPFYIQSSRAENIITEQPQQLVESVDFQGNRRLRDDDLLYYIQTRPGDQFTQQQIERDLQALLSLNFFNKTETRVLTSTGVRGGVDVIFEVTELPIIRDLQFKGTKAITESDILKAFRENRVGVSKEAIFDPVKVRNGTRVLRELLSAKGYPNAQIEAKDEQISATSIGLTFDIDQGERSRIAKIDFEGNQVFKDGELRGQLKLNKETGIFNLSRIYGTDILDRNKLQYDLNKNALDYVRSKGYLGARFGEPEVEGLGRRRTGFFLPIPFLSSVDDTLKVTIPINEGRQYRVGDVKIEGNSIFSEQQIQQFIGLQKGEVANGARLREALYETLKKFYGAQGFIEYSADLDPQLKDDPANPNQGIADFNITIDEGKQFTLRRLEFTGNTFTRDPVLRREFLVNEGDVYNQIGYEQSIIRLNQTGYFDPIDKDKDAEFRTVPERGEVDLNVRVKERGRQQISFNGGISGIGGSFFGLEYSTNNLLGRGEVLSFQVGAGNRQRSFQFSFTEPYFRDRPISIGFSAFAYSRKFFGEGTFLSENFDAQLGAVSNTGLFRTDEANLFTQDTYGVSLFASAPLSEFYRKRRFTQFSRVGLSYQFSATTIKEPPVNEEGGANAIPIITTTPNIITSRITPTFVYDSREYSGAGIDAVGGSQITFASAISGLGGDVRTYQPTLQYMKFLKMRRKRSQNPEVFGFRLLAGTIGSFGTTDKIRNANSLSFVNGVPLYERFYLGDETTIRGYNVRSIGPVAPVESYITSRNVTLATNQTNDPINVPGQQTAQQCASQNISPSACPALLGLFTGASGANPLSGGPTQPYFIGADTQLLGNFEYRIPIFGPISLAAFADVGTAFNLRKGSPQLINSNFLQDQPFLGFNTLTALFLNSNRGQQFQPTFFGGAILTSENTFLTREQFNAFIRDGVSINTQGIPLVPGLREVFLRGEAQTNTIVRVDQSVFDRFTDVRSSLGLELRVQVPVVNVPFRLIYAYNPNARNGTVENLPGLFFQEKKSVFRFSVGRTF
jgi:outer membrane protein insertion porin family